MPGWPGMVRPLRPVTLSLDVHWDDVSELSVTVTKTKRESEVLRYWIWATGARGKVKTLFSLLCAGCEILRLWLLPVAAAQKALGRLNKVVHLMENDMTTCFQA